jgi:hypothetical protein
MAYIAAGALAIVAYHVLEVGSGPPSSSPPNGAPTSVDVLGQPVEAIGQSMDVGVSIGIAFDTAAMATVDELLSEADVAMYQAKAHGKGRCHVYRPSDGPDNEYDRPVPERGGTVRRPTAARPAMLAATAPRPI